LLLSVVAVGGLAFHLWQRFAAHPWQATAGAAADEAPA
jgi:hypothetical protein